MKQILMILFVAFATVNSYSQTSNETLEYVPGAFGGATFFQNGEQLKPRDLLTITADNPEAYTLMQKAKVNHDWNQVFGVIGGFMIGWPIGTALGGGDPNWGLAAGGLGVLLLSIPLASGFKKNAIQGADVYNKGLQNSSAQSSFRLDFSVTGNGPGFTLTF